MSKEINFTNKYTANYRKVQELAQKGLDPPKIAVKLKIPVHFFMEMVRTDAQLQNALAAGRTNLIEEALDIIVNDMRTGGLKSAMFLVKALDPGNFNSVARVKNINDVGIAQVDQGSLQKASAIGDLKIEMSDKLTQYYLTLDKKKPVVEEAEDGTEG